MSIRDLIKPNVMTPLQRQVVDLDMCPHCHKKTLRYAYSCELFSAWQCTDCNRVYILDEPGASDSANEQ